MYGREKKGGKCSILALMTDDDKIVFPIYDWRRFGIFACFSQWKRTRPIRSSGRPMLISFKERYRNGGKFDLNGQF